MALVLSVNKYTIDLTATNATASANLSTGDQGGPNDYTKCVPFITKHIVDEPGTGNDWSHMSVDCYFETGPDRVTVETTGSTTRNIKVYVTVVEFNDAEADVQQGIFSLGTDAHSNTATLSPSVTVNDTFMVFHHKVADTTGENQFATIRGRITATNTLTFDRGGEGTSLTAAFENSSGSTTELYDVDVGLPAATASDVIQIGAHADGNNDTYTIDTIDVANERWSLTADNVTPINDAAETIEVITFDTAGMGAINGHWFTVEAVSSEFSVQHVDFDMDDGTTVVTDSSITGATKSMVVGSWNCCSLTDDNNNYGGALFYLASSTSVRMRRSAGTGQLNGRAQVITFTGNEAVWRGEVNELTNYTTKNIDFDATGVSEQGNSQVWITSNCSVRNTSDVGGGVNDCDGSQIAGFFVDDNTITIQREPNGEVNNWISYEVVEWDIQSQAATRRVMVIA